MDIGLNQIIKNLQKDFYLYDCNWKRIQTHIKTRTYEQVRSHAQKFYNRLKSFKDEKLGIDFTTPNIANLNDIIKIIKEKEQNSENFRKLFYIIVKHIFSNIYNFYI